MDDVRVRLPRGFRRDGFGLPRLVEGREAMRRVLPALAVGLALAAVSLPAHADIKGDHIQSANIQAEPGRQLDSASVKRVYCDLKTTGFNHVTLNPVLVQDSPTARVIRKRPAKAGVERTATDNEFRRAIRNARACGLGVIITPHLELRDGSWRAKIKSSDVGQREWTKWLLHYQALGLQEGADTLVIGLEQKGMTRPKAATKRWLSTIAALRKADPKHRMSLTYAAHTGDELLLLDAKWVKKLDYVSATWYPRIHDRGFTAASLRKSMGESKAEFDKARKRYGSKVTIAETGIRSLDYAHRYGRPGSAEYEAGWADVGLQDTWYRAMLRTVDGWSSVDGVMLYRTFNAPSSGGVADRTFTWRGKPAEKTIAGYFGGKVPR